MKIKRYVLLSFFIIAACPQLLLSQEKEHLNAVTAIYKYILLEDERSDINLGQLWYEREFSSLTTIFKLRYTNRFNSNDYLAEIDLYPVFSENSYAHFKIGASLLQNELFPDFKASGIFFHNITESLIGGAGLRYLSFDTDDLVIYNLALHWYISDYLFLLQNYLQFRQNEPLATVVLTARKYLTFPGYLSVKFAIGRAPVGLRTKPDILNTFESYLLRIASNIKLSNRFLLRTAIKYRKFNFSSTTSRGRFGISGGLTYRF